MGKLAARYSTDAPLLPSADHIQEPQAYWTLVPLLEDPHNHRQIIVTRNSTSKIKTLVVTPIAVTEYKHYYQLSEPSRGDLQEGLWTYKTKCNHSSTRNFRIRYTSTTRCPKSTNTYLSSADHIRGELSVISKSRPRITL